MTAARALVRLVLILIVAVALTSRAEDVISGRWEGTAQIPDNELSVVIDLAQENGAWVGSIIIPGLGIKGVSLNDIRVQPPDVNFAVKGGPGIELKLRLDANGAWDRRAAEHWLERCADRPVEHVEQPCFATASEGPARRERVEDMLRGLAGDYPTPIALDESIVGNGDIERWLEADWSGIFVVKPSLLGNAEAALAKLAAAKATVVFSSALETAVGAKAALRLAFRWTGERRALGFGVWPLFADSQFDGPQAAPFLRWEDVAQINAEVVWKALS